MKQLQAVSFMALAPILLVAPSCRTASPSETASVTGATDDSPITASIAVLSVNGMSCPLCANNIEKQMKRLDGVTKVTVDLGAGTVRVDLPGAKKPSRKQLADAIHNSGFTLTKIEAD